MIRLNQIECSVLRNPIFSQNYIKNINRKSLIRKYPNQKRNYHFFSNLFLFKLKQRSYLENWKKKSKKLTEVLTFILQSLLVFYTVGFSFNYLEALSLNTKINKDMLFGFFNLTFFLVLSKLFFSRKNFEEQFLKRVLTSYVYLNLVRITEYCTLLSGHKDIWILFKIFNYFAINWNLWNGKNDTSMFPVSNENENEIFWKIKIFFLATFSIEIFLEIFSTKYFQISIEKFPDLLYSVSSWLIFLEEKTYKFVTTNLWYFSTLSASFIVFTHLSLLYFIAFGKISGDSEKFSSSMKNFLFNNFTIKNNKLKEKTKQRSTVSYLNSFKTSSSSSSTIEELLASENVNLISGQKEKNTRWKIKKKGIKTPFAESAWNGELPLLKQSLWYEIKSK